MSSHNYTTGGQNLIDDDDVDDETFLKNSTRPRGTNPFEVQQISYQEKARAIEERTLASSNRSLGLLYETEQVGVATAEELARQREQLENTNKQLDDINQTLRFSQKHLNGLKSIFGGLKNYIAGQKDMQPPPSNTPKPNLSDKIQSPTSSYNQFSQKQSPSVNSEFGGGMASNNANDSSGSNFNKQLDRNLDEMAGSLSRLKGLAIDLHTEIDDQNELIDDITTKVENVDAKMGKQNKEINLLIGKK